MSEKNNLDKYTGILFELKIGLNKDNAIVIDYGGKPVGIGEHPQFADEIDKQLAIIGCASEKLRVINKHYPIDNDDAIPF